MRRLAGSRLGATFTLSVVLVAGRRGRDPRSVQPEARPGVRARRTSTPMGVEVSRVGAARARAATEVELPRPVRGANAVRLLGDQLDEAAAING